MPFTSSLPTWNKTATAPTTTKQNAGWGAGEKPPASIFDWFFNTTFKALQELQQEAVNIDQKGVANGIATLDATGDLPIGQADNILNWVKGFGLGDVAQDISSADLNTLSATGFFKGSNLTNGPFGLTNGIVIYVKYDSSNAAQIFIDINADGAIYIRRKFNIAYKPWIKISTDIDPVFTNLTLLNGATVANGATPRYTKVGKKVDVEGLLTQGITAGTIVAQLPVGCRPPADRFFKTALNTLTSNDGCTFFVRASTGDITLQAVANATNSISLSGISFYVD